MEKNAFLDFGGCVPRGAGTGIGGTMAELQTDAGISRMVPVWMFYGVRADAWLGENSGLQVDGEYGWSGIWQDFCATGNGRTRKREKNKKRSGETEMKTVGVWRVFQEKPEKAGVVIRWGSGRWSWGLDKAVIKE